LDETNNVEIMEDDEPDQFSIPDERSSFHFILIADLSHTHTKQTIQATKEALKVFIQNLPTGCKFSIITFGAVYELHQIFGDQTCSNGIWECEPEVIAEAVNHIDTLIGKPGRPNMFHPLCAALKVFEDH
jgi:hypothetical protein